jgi:hypothetical protein
MALLLTDPYAIFAQARERWESARYPSQLAYDVVVSVTRRGVNTAAHYHLYYDAQANSVKVNAVSDEELAHPYTPHGINTFFNVFGGSLRSVRLSTRLIISVYRCLRRTIRSASHRM